MTAATFGVRADGVVVVFHRRPPAGSGAMAAVAQAPAWVRDGVAQLLAKKAPTETIEEEVLMRLPSWGDTRREEWLRARAELRERIGNSAVERSVWKTVKRVRLMSQQRSWHDVLPPEIVDWAISEFVRVEGRELVSCVDNRRVARADIRTQRRRFVRQRRAGCEREWSAVGPDGNTYFFGFNYGH